MKNPPTNGEKGSNRTYAYDALGRMTMASNDATGKSTYTYAAHGLSARRTPWITQAVEERKTQENGLVGQINTYVKGQDVLFEHLTWRSDHKLASQRLQRKGSAKTQHTYHYNVLGQLEKDIYTYPGLGVTPTYTYGYDALGVLTKVEEAGNVNGNASWNMTPDRLHRVSQETVEIEENATVLLEGETSACTRQVHVSANGGNRVEAIIEQIGDTNHWHAQLSGLKLGESNRIKVTATSDEDIATDEVFSKLLEPYVVSEYDELGNLTSRRNALTGAATNYTWDTWGRLTNVSEHSSDGVLRSWSYRYDALGRRLETQYEGDQSITIQSFCDPEFEYLELGLRIKRKSGKTLWKQYGPDASGYYGSLNGIGGLEGIIHGKTGDSMGVINDVVGDIAAYTYHGETYFLEGNVDNYGRLTGDEWLTEDAEDIMSNAVFWVLKNSRFRGRRVEGNGLSNFGARYYNVETGSFLSADPYGHDGSLDLYSYASADPVNYVDPDGRLSQPVNEGSGSSWKDFAAQTLGTINSFLADSTPFIGTAKAVNEFHTGRDPLTGESIGRVWAAAGVVGSIIPGGKPAVKGARKVVQTGAKALEAGFRAAKGLVKTKTITKNASLGASVAKGLMAPIPGQKIYRVYGGDSFAGGASWSPIRPDSIPHFRDAAGLPSGGISGATNTGQFVIHGTLVDPSKVVRTRSALPLDGNKGGLPEYIIPRWRDNGAIRVDRVSGVNPEF